MRSCYSIWKGCHTVSSRQDFALPPYGRERVIRLYVLPTRIGKREKTAEMAEAAGLAMPSPVGIDAIHCREFSWDDGHDLERAMPSGPTFHAQAQLIPRDDLWGIHTDGPGKTLKPEGIGEEACLLRHGGVISGLLPPFASSSVHSRRSSLLHSRKGELFVCEEVMLSFEMLIVFSEI